jgi:hypothetical protein
MAEDFSRQELLTALTTEHFTLQGARSQTVGESAARSSLYLGSVSSALIALGFVSEVSEGGDAFQLFALAALPTLYFLGLFTFVRLVESSVEDLLYGRAINRIRHYYLELAGSERRYFMMGGSDDVPGVLSNMGLGRGPRWQLFATTASMVSVVNSVVGGSCVAILFGVTLDLPLAVAPSPAQSSSSRRSWPISATTVATTRRWEDISTFSSRRPRGPEAGRIARPLLLSSGVRPR